MPVALRPVTEDDYDIYKAYFAEIEERYEPMSKKLWTEQHLKSSQVITYDGKDVGYIWPVVIKKLLYVFELGVDREYKKKGIGRKALELLRESAIKQGYNSIALHCEKFKEAALGLYLGAGFKVMHEAYSLAMDSEKLKSVSTESSQHDSVMVQPTFSKSDWDYVEQRYPMIDGAIEVFAGDAYIPIKLTRSDEICGFCILGTEDNILWRIAVDRGEDFIPFVVAVSKMFIVQTELVHLWVEKNRKFVDYILESVLSAKGLDVYNYMMWEL